MNKLKTCFDKKISLVRLAQIGVLVHLFMISSAAVAIPPLTVIPIVAPPGERPQDVCVAAAAGMGVTIDLDFSHWQCSAGNVSNDFPAFPALAHFNLPPGASTEDATARIQLSVYSSPATSDACEWGLGNPILPSTGTKIQTEVDYQGGGALPLKVIRTFSSANPIGPSSELWSWSFGNKMQLSTYPGTGYALAYYPDRRYVGFVQQEDGSWNALGGAKITLTSVDDNLELSNFDGDRVETFDSFGNIATVDKMGSRLTFFHDEVEGQKSTTVSNPYGSFITIHYNDQSVPERIIDPAGNIIWYTYAQGNTQSNVTNLVGVIYGDTSATQQADAPRRVYHYEDSSYPAQYSERLLTGITDERGVRYATFEYEYSSATSNHTNYFRATASENAGVNRYEFSFLGDDVEVINPLGKKTIYNYVEIDRTRKISGMEGIPTPSCLGTLQSVTYDDNGFTNSVTDPNGNITTVTNNAKGQPVATSLAIGTQSERTITRSWHPKFRLPTQISHPDYSIDNVYNNSGQLLSKTVTDVATDQSRIWAYTYDSFGRTLTADGPRTDVNDTTIYTYHSCNTGNECGQLATVTTALGHLTSYPEYNAHGQVTKIIDINGVTTTISYDARRRPTGYRHAGVGPTIEYDAAGNIARMLDADGSSLTYTWDDANRLIGVFDGAGNKISWELDSAGNRLSEQLRDASNTLKRTHANTFDALSRLRTMVYAHGGVTTYGYDKNNNNTSKIDAATRETISQYDALDRLISYRDAIAGETLYSYNSLDQVTSVIDPEGVTTNYLYNGFAEVEQENSPDAGLTTFTYDDAGNMVTRTDARGVTELYTYDVLNRLTGVAYPNSAENITYTYDQGVNGIGRLTGVTDQSGSLGYSYDARGNTVATVYEVGGQQYSVGYSYSAADRLTSITMPSGRVVNYDYDQSGRVNTVTSTVNGVSENLASAITRLPFGPMSSLSLGNGIARERTYDQDYRVSNIADGAILQRNYGWNAVNNIAAITDTVNADSTQLFTYDDLDRLSFATGAYGEQTFSYDGVGNRLSLASSTENQVYQYEADSHRLSAIVGERSFTYDAAGNTLNNGLVNFSYNNRNRMESATVNGVMTTYRHNALGQRVSKTNALGIKHYIYDLGGRLIAEATDQGEIQVEYAYLDAEPLVMWREDEPAPTMPPGLVTPLSPTGAIATANPDLSWEDEGTSAEYQVLVYDRLLGARALFKRYQSTDICVDGICSISPTLAMNYSANHFWRVRGLNTQGWGEWSAYTLFDYLDAVPGAITPIAPIAVTDSATPAYQWQDLGNALEYQVLVYDRTLAAQVHAGVYTSSDICADGFCSTVPEGVTLNFNPNHFWRIRGKNSGGWSAWSAPIRFGNIDAIPITPEPIAPIGVTSETQPTYEWAVVSNAVDYHLIVQDRILNTRVYNKLLSASDICNATSCQITPIVSVSVGTDHYWRIRALNSGGWSDWSALSRFDVQTGGQ